MNRPRVNIHPSRCANRARSAALALAIVVAAVLGASVLGGCGKREAVAAKKADAETREVTLVPVVSRAMDRFVEVTGTLFGEEDVTIAAEVPGRIVEIAADLGDSVEHGAMLAVIDPTDFALAVDEQKSALLAALAKIGLDELPEGEVDLSVLPLVMRAVAQESNAKARLERARRLYERTPPLISEQDFADIQTQYEVARTVVEGERLTAQSLLADARVRASSLRQAEQRLRDTRVIAPVETPLNYRVAARNVSVGEVVAQGQSLFRLVASDRVKFRGLVPERFAQQIKAGTEASIVIDGFAEPFSARVTRIAPAVDIATRSFGIEIDASNPDGSLKPGSFAKARILTKTDHEVRSVPESATVQFAGVQRLFSVRDGKVVEHRIRLGQSLGGMVEVLDLPAGVEAVIDRPARGIGQGVGVRVGG